METKPAKRPMPHFTVRQIEEDSWPQILRIQAEAYVDIEPESLETLRSKWLNSPECCLLSVNAQGPCAYLLAHAWHSDSPPKLYQLAPPSPQGDLLYIHDLAVAKRAAGMGVGKQMVTQLLGKATAQGFRKVILVSVQNSVPFWSKFGFEIDPQHKVNASYGAAAQLMYKHLDK